MVTLKKIQMKWLEEHFSYRKEGYKFIITKILKNEVSPIVDKRGTNPNSWGKGYTDFEQFKPKKEDWDSIGVYKIEQGNRVYIGSTTIGFRERFMKHKHRGGNELTRKMIKNGGSFKIIKIMDGMSEDDIRKKETQILKEHIDNGKYNIVNLEMPTKINYYQSAKRVVRYKNIKVKKENYEKAIGLLKGHGLA